MLVLNAGGQLVLMVAHWKLLDIRVAIGSMLMFQKARGQRLQAFMIF